MEKRLVTKRTEIKSRTLLKAKRDRIKVKKLKTWRFKLTFLQTVDQLDLKLQDLRGQWGHFSGCMMGNNAALHS